jgi:hypothetical protein
MDPYTMQALAASRGDDLAREARESRLARLARLARESREDSKPAPRPTRGTARARRLSVAR